MNKLKINILVKKVRSGDSKAFETLYQNFRDKIYSFIFFKVSSKDDALELTQEVFLKVWNYLQKESTKEVENFQALLYTIARATIAGHYQDRSRQHEIVEGDIADIDYKISDTDESPDAQLDIKIRTEKILSKIDQLDNTEFKQVIELRYIQDLSHRDIAQIMDKTEGNIRVILHRAIKKLQESLQEND